MKHVLSFSPSGVYEIFRDNKKHVKRIKTQERVIHDYVNANEVKKYKLVVVQTFSKDG